MPCNISPFRGTICLAALMLGLCAFPRTHTMRRISWLSAEALSNRRYLQGVFCPARYRCVMRGSGSVPPRKAWNRACCSDSAARRISIKALQDRVPLESRCCLAAYLVLLFRRTILCEGKKQKHSWTQAHWKMTDNRELSFRKQSSVNSDILIGAVMNIYWKLISV